jgi:nucleotide-binding universal stress UspA family protein
MLRNVWPLELVMRTGQGRDIPGEIAVIGARRMVMAQAHAAATLNAPVVTRTTLVTAVAAPVVTKRIAVGTDGSYWGDAALGWAARHALVTGAELEVHQADRRYVDIPDDIPNDAGIGSTLRSMPMLPVRIRRSGPDPVGTLVGASADADLVVLGCRGHHHGTLGVGRSVVPIVTRARCDTVVVRGVPSGMNGRTRWITAMVRGSSEDIGVLAKVAKLAGSLQSKVRVVHVTPPAGPRWLPEQLSSATVLERAAAQLAKLAPKIAPDLRSFACQPPEAAVACPDTDLLVIGDTRLTDRNRLDPMTKAALYHSRSPVLVVRN